MESERLFACAIICILYLSSSWVGVNSQAGTMPCMQKLLPCQPFLSNPVGVPPPTCCLPLKETIGVDPSCLCKVFNNPALLKTLNITQDDALKLPKACNTNADISICSKVGVTPTGSPTVLSPPTDDKKGGSHRVINVFGGYGFVALCVSLVMSAF
ncbi:hypothetical protein GIB67_020976 [Kingdonia uniflora]|uniref:Bifunctional inhibitor/plant lipid transfer protein/seed storage helical domain-containing protein n=1 Tax=Kingdonia uniflora TaxID=39325 RepID=A0A7J7M7Q1_9MAGN|nr:hypothetical protein GIB67_020976 [Kingdonia uniflora]